MGNQARFGSGARSEPQDDPGAGRREAQFGPEISWPYGFRPLDPGSRDALESAYGTAPLNTGPRNAGPLNTGQVNSSYGSGSVYQPPAVDDYGDPGYSDPSYDGPAYGGPSAPHTGPAYPASPAYPSRAGSQGSGSAGGFSGGPASPAGSGGFGTPRGFGGDSRRPSAGGAPGYQLPEPPRVQETSRSGYQAPPSDVWPVTGAQEALSGTGPQPSAGGRHGFPRSDQSGYPEQRYDSPRLDDRPLDDQRSFRSPDPRLEGMTYGELRYDDTGSFAATPDAEPAPSGELLDDESWYQELRRSAPAYPENPAPRGPVSGPQRRVEPQHPHGPAFGAPSGGYPQAPGRASGSGPSRWDGPDRPQLSAAPNAPRPAGRGGPQAAQISAGLTNPAAQGHSFLSAPVAPAASIPTTSAPSFSPSAASVGLLTSPGDTRVEALRDGALPAAPATAAAPSFTETRASHALKAASATRPRPAAVRPGHGLDGPGITGSWPTQPVADDDLESYDDFWRDDADEEYTGLFGDREAEHRRAVAKAAAAAKRQIGRRRGRSNDHRLWFGLVVVLVVFAAVLAVVVKIEFLSSHSGPAHTMKTPDKIGAFTRTADLEHSADLNALKAKVITSSAGQASNVVSAVYESGNSAAGNTAQIVMFIGGHLANADPAASIAGFTQQYRGAKVVSAGPGGGKAACVPDGTGANAAAMCVWFDNDSFGEVVSPTMNATALAKELQAVRPAVEVRA